MKRNHLDIEYHIKEVVPFFDLSNIPMHGQPSQLKNKMMYL